MAIVNPATTRNDARSEPPEGSELLLPVATPPAYGTTPDSPQNPEASETDAEDEEDEEQKGWGFVQWEFWAKCALWISGSSALAYAVSALVHSAIMIMLSIVIVHGNVGLGNVNTLLGFNGDGPPGAGGGNGGEDLDTRIDLGGSSEDPPLAVETEALQSLTPQTASKPTLPALNSIPQLSSLAVPEAGKTGTGTGGKRGTGGKGFGSGNGAGIPGGIQGFNMPGGGKAIVQGNFTAWTVPEDPRPFESYLIVVQVTLPRRFSTLPEGDISGWVDGTDHYHLNINSYTSTYFPKSKQIVIRVPGAESRVRDTIHVQSKLLKEKQDLKIEF